MDKKSIILASRSFERYHLLPDIEPVAYLSHQKLSMVDYPVLSDAKQLQAFIASHEVNAFLISDSGQDAWQLYGNLLQSTGRMIEKQTNEKNVLVANPSKNRLALGVKRLFDIVVSLALLLPLLVFFPLINFLVQKQSPGDFIFRQNRIGKDGKIFTMYKFRSMHLGAEEQKGSLLAENEVTSDLMFKMEDDPRIFPLGKTMRKWSIDELPQLFNVLKGDMSLVGSRPPTLDEYEKYDFHHFKRLAMKPGITGMWQTNGRSNVQDFETVVSLDSYYVDNWSLWLDVKILLKTIIVVLKKEGSR